MKGRYLRNFTRVSIGVVSILLLLHTFFNKHLTIDNTTVLLLVVVLLIPFLPWVTRIKYGDFEAEIGREEIREIKNDLDKTAQQPSNASPARKDELESLRELIHTDATVALLKIRLAIEERLRSLMIAYEPERSKERTNISPMVHILKHAGVMDDQLASAIRGVASVANRALHGESIAEANLDDVVDIALRVIRSLDSLVFERAMQSMHTKHVEANTVEHKMNATYEIVTIVPYTDSPEQRTYHMNQAELDAWLENYADYAEFIVSVREATAKSN